MTRTLVWFRDDLRITDHPALSAARDLASGPGDIVGVYLLDETSAGIRPLGGASRWWLHHALVALRKDLAQLGVPLLIRRGDPARLLVDLAETSSADRVHWSRRYGGGERQLDASVKQELPEHGIQVHSFAASVLREPWEIQTGSGGPYRVFTPFWESLREDEPRAPLGVPETLGPVNSAIASLSGSGIALGDPTDLELLPTSHDWTAGLHQAWEPTESGAHHRLETFLQQQADHYSEAGQRPAAEATSRLSPYLRWGQLSPHQVWDAAQRIDHEPSRHRFRTELGWREFGWHLLYHFPGIPQSNMRSQFDDYPWQSKEQQPEVFQSWATGRTGFPLVDAGMRELWATGHMHNRVRMVVASLLVKNLGIDWRDGEAWFWDTLVDADAASNPVNWQWVAGSGVDAAPYFRIFNPERQRERFDPDDDYTLHWVPEQGTAEYPEPIVDLRESRQEALAHYSTITSD